ncbi:ATP-binding cassette domain-containing protein, partial [Erysipelothrix rhusiopathiae]|nr:ATP-binding cassette domain-containing protein [Erysipelothrix rhusiopathiae]
HVGEQGGMLSGGQRQRIAIARALISEAPILIMDEPTSALDSESEQLIQKAIANIQNEKTILIAAHRLSTIRDADKIIVLNQGVIVEMGTHDSLLTEHGVYERFVQSQHI